MWALKTIECIECPDFFTNGVKNAGMKSAQLKNWAFEKTTVDTSWGILTLRMSTRVQLASSYVTIGYVKIL